MKDKFENSSMNWTLKTNYDNLFKTIYEVAGAIADLQPHELQSSFLRLPVEIRLHICSFLMPKTLDIDLCTPCHSIADSNSPDRERSPIIDFTAPILTFNTLIQSSGLHLLIVSKRTRQEILSFLKNTIFRFHCSWCFEEMLRKCTYGLELGVTWMRNIQIFHDVNPSKEIRARIPTNSFSRPLALEAMQSARRTAVHYYGRHDLKERGIWNIEKFPGSRRLQEIGVAAIAEEEAGVLFAGNILPTASSILSAYFAQKDCSQFHFANGSLARLSHWTAANQQPVQIDARLPSFPYIPPLVQNMPRLMPNVPHNPNPRDDGIWLISALLECSIYDS